jgi:hypothetical protein
MAFKQESLRILHKYFKKSYISSYSISQKKATISNSTKLRLPLHINSHYEMVTIKLIAIVVLILSAAFLGLALRIFVRGSYDDTEFETNPNMRDLGIKCAKHQELETYCKNKKLNSIGCTSCKGCS